jgi:glycosyltransferase involved in cell wall biosynthesis
MSSTLERDAQSPRSSGEPTVASATPGAALPSWALVICTYNRKDVLLRCLRAALAQTVAPAEVIVVDASADWEAGRAGAERLVAPFRPALRFAYVEAREKRLPAQRNQGIELSAADVLFMIDDDSLMYPDCAREILRVYAADVNRRIASVGATEAPAPTPGAAPDEPGFVPQPVEQRDQPMAPGLLGAMRWRLAHLFDRGEPSFIPYGGRWPMQEIPPECAGMDLKPVRSLNGYRMTFRREVIARERFVDWFIGSAPFEDIDATHRASRHGVVVESRRARLVHLLYHTGRLDHYTLAALWVMNGAILQRLFGEDKEYLARIWRKRVARQVPLELLKDLAKGRVRLPATRGMLFGRRHLKGINAKTPQELEAWYPGVQQALREGRRLPSAVKSIAAIF